MKKLVLIVLCLGALIATWGLTGASVFSRADLTNMNTPNVPRIPETEPAILNPIERVEYSEDWRKETTRNGRSGDTAFVILRTGLNGCTPITAQGATIYLSALLPIAVTVPSSDGGKTGLFHEIVAPRTPQTCLKSRYVLAEWTFQKNTRVEFDIDGTKLAVNAVLDPTHKKRRPFFVGQSLTSLIRGHCPAPAESKKHGYCKKERELSDKYAKLLAKHHIRPMQNWLVSPSIKQGRLDLDQRAATGLSFRQLVFPDNETGLIGFPRMARYKEPVKYLKALEATVKAENLEGRAWVYVADEPKDIKKLAKDLALYRQFSPSVKTMVTTSYTPELEGLVDIFAPVFNNLVSSHKPSFNAYKRAELWTYLSCMGSCGPNRAWKPNAPKVAGPDTGLADLLIDRPASLLFSFFETIKDTPVSSLLYYEISEGNSLYRLGIDPLVDTWNFGGNGDGMLVFPGRPGEFGLTEHTPLASLRLKFLRHALQTY